ncbi:MAG: flagellar basal body-associated FliL family protein [Rhodomicrobium sp.]
MTDGASSKGALVGVVIGTLAAAGGGFGFATVVLSHADCSAGTAAAPAKEEKPPERQIWPLQSIVTNLGSPADTYVRLEAGIVIEAGTSDADAIAARVATDFLAYLRTVSLAEIQGPTGFQYFREDLKSHAIKQGRGKVQDVYITGFVIE